MRVDLQNINQNVDMEKNTYRVPDYDRAARIAEMTTGYSLDITGNVTDNMAYEETGLKSAEDFKISADALDVTAQRNYMAVMSNSMSTEDFAAMQEEGYHPGDIPVEDIVTNLDKIKAKMAESGEVIEGFNDDLTAKEMAKITGNPALAEQIAGSLKSQDVPVTEENIRDINEALDATKKIETITDSMVKFLVNNDLEPTIDNLYKAQYSSGENPNHQSGKYYRDETRGYYARKAEEINWDQIKDSVDKVITEAGLNKEETYEDAKWMLEQGMPLRADTLNKVHELKHLEIPKDQPMLIDVMAQSIAGGEKAGQSIISERNATPVIGKASDEISLKRFTEETRLAMSIKANRSLMRRGLVIDTKELERAVNQLKEAEKELFGEAIDIIHDVAVQPAESIQTAAFDTADFTLRDLREIGQPIKASYEQAMKSYEAIWTAPRADMGDSIQKAFRNVDDILTDMDLKLDDINRKTMRILGYTQTEVTPENFEKVRQATEAVLDVIENMTPEKTLEMIRDGFNPLNESVTDVAKYLKSKKASDKAESYSEFIWKLDKNDQVTESEKEAYIGIYRLIRQIEKNDGRPIGDVLAGDEELTLQNLLTAVRNRNNSGIDVSVDDAFGLLEELKNPATSISEQIMQAFSRVIKTSSSKETDMEYAKELRMEMKEATKVSDSVINTLLDAEAPVNADNLTAMDHLIHMRGLTFSNLKKLIDKSDSSDKKEILSKIKEFKDNLDSDDAEDSYRDMVEDAVKFVDSETFKSINPVEVKELRLLNKQLSLCGKLVRRENYEIPMEIEGEMTSVNLKIVRGSEDASCKITFSSKKYGNVSARFSPVGDELKGYAVSDNEEGIKLIESRRNDFAAAAGYDRSNIDYLVNDTVKIDDYIYSDSENKSDVKQLYRIAKAFLNNL